MSKSLLKTYSNVLLIHHWDTDGICSASILLQLLQDKIVKSVVPQLGRYYLVEEEIELASQFEHIIVADISLPKKDINTLSRNSQVTVFDHHIQPRYDILLHHNPILDGFNPLEYPSASVVISKFFQRSFDILSFLGAVGDRGKQIKKNPVFWDKLQGFIEEHKTSFTQILLMAEILDSIHRVGDKKEVEIAPYLLLEHSLPEYILGREAWLNNLIRLEKTVQSILSTPPESIEGVQLKVINTHYNVISNVTRTLSWDTGKDTIVVNKGLLEDYAQLYVRSVNKNLQPLISFFMGKGYSVGGKRDVLGALIPINAVDTCIKSIVEKLSEA